MATYNGQNYLKEQIDSILCQLGRDDELVISDDNSTDKTQEIIKAYTDSRIRFFENELAKGVTHNF
jgi:glycosyltransferase involved in cell wall biosynthesis